MRKAILIGALGALSAVLFSGCFAMRTLTYSDNKVDAGKKVTANISVAGNTTEGPLKSGLFAGKGDGGSEHPFFWMVSEGGSTLVNGGTFDVHGVFDGPVDLSTNEELAVEASDVCSTFLPVAAKGPGIPATAVTTEDPFVATNERKFMDAKVPIRAASNPEQGGDGLVISMGTWADDGDGVPEDDGASDDTYQCQPPYTSFIKIKGAIVKP